MDDGKERSAGVLRRVDAHVVPLGAPRFGPDETGTTLVRVEIALAGVIAERLTLCPNRTMPCILRTMSVHAGWCLDCFG
jgi:hypothetical protein